MIPDPNSPRLDDTRPLSPRTLLGSALSSFKSLSREVLFTIFNFENLGKFRLVSCHTKEKNTARTKAFYILFLSFFLNKFLFTVYNFSVMTTPPISIYVALRFNFPLSLPESLLQMHRRGSHKKHFLIQLGIDREVVTRR